jgi:hypothetical protein
LFAAEQHLHGLGRREHAASSHCRPSLEIAAGEKNRVPMSKENPAQRI